ncbi:MAG: ComF family protein [Candidatus Eisenbacteria bacterium]|uniref:ComF family protein n=1 Tax=Eiseniibacteriota bacterium TaxID=2212470 RepID=A0A7Y2EF92_UNCEI|nr:ComF family protein [Candidatus Eisenbacteria bacterium]
MGSPLDRIIHKLKYEGQANLASGLARALVGQVPPGSPEVSGILPVPLHRVRQRDRGYNQSSLLAAGLEASWGVPVLENIVTRRRPTAAQAQTPQEARALNMEGAFRVNQPKMAKSRSWIILDDVATTGSTLVEVARTLRASGASRSRLIVVALA